MQLSILMCSVFGVCRPPVSRAAPLPEKLVKNNVNKKKKVVEVCHAF